MEKGIRDESKPSPEGSPEIIKYYLSLKT